MATNTPIFIIVTNHSDDSIPVSTLVANFMKKAMVKDLVKELAKKLAKEQVAKELTKEQAKELAYDTVNDLVIDSAIVLAEDLSKEKDDSVKVFSLVYEFLKQIQPLELEEKKTIVSMAAHPKIRRLNLLFLYKKFLWKYIPTYLRNFEKLDF